MAKLKYFPHIAGSLVLASAATVGILHKWEPAKGSPDAHLQDRCNANVIAGVEYAVYYGALCSE